VTWTRPELRWPQEAGTTPTALIVHEPLLLLTADIFVPATRDFVTDPSEANFEPEIAALLDMSAPERQQRFSLRDSKRLEYRGYDSAGIAVFQKGKIEIRRKVGKLKNLEELIERRPLTERWGSAILDGLPMEGPRMKTLTPIKQVK
jgi:hypothetical protein